MFFKYFNSLLNKNLAMTKLKALAEVKLDVAKQVISVFDRVENIVGKGKKMLGTRIFSSCNTVVKRLLPQDY